MQLFSVLSEDPPPKYKAELSVSVQLFSVPPYGLYPYAPPPSSAELPLSVQLFSVAAYGK
jgi:hypothetical protein